MFALGSEVVCRAASAPGLLTPTPDTDWDWVHCVAMMSIVIIVVVNVVVVVVSVSVMERVVVMTGFWQTFFFQGLMRSGFAAKDIRRSIYIVK
jgi:hypothetical protein